MKVCSYDNWFWAGILTLSILIAFSCPVLARPSAGLEINTQASVLYEHGSTSVYQDVSNVVALEVLPIYELELTGGGTLSSSPGETLYLQFAMKNLGNTADVLLFSVDGEEGLPPIVWYYDVDRNNPLDTMDDSGRFVTSSLAQGASHLVVGLMEIPVAQRAGSFFVDVLSYSDGDNHIEESIQYQVILNEVSVGLTGDDQVYMGSEFSLTIHYENPGSLPINDAVLDLVLDASVVFVSEDHGGVYDVNTHTLRWDLGVIPPVSQWVIQVTVEAKQAAAFYGVEAVSTVRLSAEHGFSRLAEHRTLLGNRFAANLLLSVNPQTILGDGESTAVFTAVISDLFGNTVEDGDQVRFFAPQGTFVGSGSQETVVSTSNGIAEAVLTAPLMESLKSFVIPVTVSAFNPATGDVQEQVEIVFAPGAVQGRLVVSVTDEPLAGAQVTLVRNGKVIATVTTDERGYYFLPVPAIGDDYEINVTRLRDNGEVETFTMPVSVDALFGAVTEGPSLIRGRVVYEGSQQGVPGTTIHLYNEDGGLLGVAFTDGQGGFEIRVEAQDLKGLGLAGLAVNSWMIRAFTAAGDVVETSLSPLNQGDIIVNLSIVVEADGEVTDGVTGNAIMGASVYLLDEELAADGGLADLPLFDGSEQQNPRITEAVGRYVFHVEPGRYQLRAAAENYHTYLSNPFSVAANRVANDIVLYPLGDTDLLINKSVNKAIAHPGAIVEYVLEINNATSWEVSGIVIEDTLPDDLSYVDGSAAKGGVYDEETHMLRWTLEQFPPGAEVLTYQAKMNQFVPGTQVENKAVLHASGFRDYASSSAMVIVSQSLDVELQSEPDVVRFGEFVRYTVTVRNPGNDVATATSVDTTIVGQLPQGFAYVSGTSTIGGKAVSNPKTNGADLEWLVGDILPGEELVLTYTALVTIAAQEGESFHSVTVSGLTEGIHPFTIGPLRTRTLVLSGVFGQAGTLVGQVFHDRNGNGVRDSGELGLSDIHLYLDNGLRIITDSYGRFSLQGMEPGLRVVTVDEGSLPQGMVVGSASASQFVKMLPRGLSELLIPIRPAETPANQVGVTTRLQEIPGEQVLVEIVIENTSDAVLQGLLQVDAGITTGRAEFHFDNPQEAILELGAKERVVVTGSLGLELAQSAAAVYLVSVVIGPTERVWALDTVTSIVTKPSDGADKTIVAPVSGELLPIRRESITVKADFEEEAYLYVNNESVDESRVGRIKTDYDHKTVEKTYYSVEFEVGKNQILVETIGPEGVTFEQREVFVVGPPVGVHLLSQGWLMDQGETLTVRIPGLIVDAYGLPVQHSVTARVVASGGRVLGRSVSEQRAVYVTSNEGYLLVEVEPDDISSTPVEVSISVAGTTTDVVIPVRKPAIVPIIAGGGSVVAKLTPLFGVKAYGSGFLEVAGDPAVRVRFDSRLLDKKGQVSENFDRERLLIGDRSVVEDRSPSQQAGYFYASNDSGSILYGDFGTRLPTASRFTNLERAVTGLRATMLDGRLHAFHFAERWTEQRDKMRGTGISDFYYATKYPIISGTESVWLIVEEPDGDGEISRTLLKPRVDYQINYATGALSFTTPVPSVDEAFHPIYIELAYAVDGGEAQTSGYGFWAELTNTSDHRASLRYLAGTSITEGLPGYMGVEGQTVNEEWPIALNYEVSYLFPTSGIATYANLTANPSDRLHIGLVGQRVHGEFAPPMQPRPLPEGYRVTGSIDYDFDENWSLGYSKSVDKTVPIREPYTDSLHLRGTLSEQIQGSIGVRSVSETLGLLSPRTSTTGIMTSEWTPSASTKLSLTNEYSLSGGLERELTEIRYAQTFWSVVQASAIYRDRLTQTGTNTTWNVGLQATPLEGSVLYGQYQPALRPSDAGRTIVGGRQDLQVTRNLAAFASREYRRTFNLAGASKSSDAMAVGLRYRMTQHILTSLGYEWLAEDDRLVTRTDLSLTSVERGSGFTYLFNSSWRSNSKPPLDRRDLMQEVNAAIAYRNTDVTRHTVLAEYRYRDYRTKFEGNPHDYHTEVSAVSVDWLYRLSNGIAISSQFAAKLVSEQEKAHNAVVSLNRSSIYLGQAGFEAKLYQDYQFEVFWRRMWDNDGQQHAGWAVELTRDLTEYVGLGLGYSTLSVDDPDLQGLIDWPRGLYLRFRAKF